MDTIFGEEGVVGIQLRDFSMQSDSDDNRVSEMQDALASQHVTNYQSTGIKAVTEGAPKDKWTKEKC
ncbi:UNVERIFIED_CONTAM: hypothetical protein NCL1_40518 [Trichonephila clavipes]